jgi:hypothetical protein
MLLRGSNEDTDAFEVAVGLALPKRDGVVGIVFCKGDVGSREASSCVNVSRFVFVGNSPIRRKPAYLMDHAAHRLTLSSS